MGEICGVIAKGDKLIRKKSVLGAVAVTGLCLTILSAPSLGLVIYVDDDAPFGGDGSSWQKAYRYLQDALVYLAEGDEIRVAQGRYMPHLYGGSPPRAYGREFRIYDRTDQREMRFEARSSVVLKGGYAGRDAPDPNVRDVSLYETILTGDLWDNDIWTDDPYGADVVQMLTDNSRRIMVVDEAGEASIDRFIITGAAFGVSIDETVAIVRDCTLIRNSGDGRASGIGLTCSRSDVTVLACRFEANTGKSRGKGINSYASDVTVKDSVFVGNCSDRGSGAGIYCDKHGGIYSLHVEGCLFQENGCGEGLDLEHGSGGAIHTLGYEVVVRDCQFLGNSAEMGGSIKLRKWPDSALPVRGQSEQIVVRRTAVRNGDGGGYQRRLCGGLERLRLFRRALAGRSCAAVSADGTGERSDAG